MKSGNLNFLEPSGPLQACNGTDLAFCVIVKTFDYSHLYILYKIPVTMICVVMALLLRMFHIITFWNLAHLARNILYIQKIPALSVSRGVRWGFTNKTCIQFLYCYSFNDIWHSISDEITQKTSPWRIFLSPYCTFTLSQIFSLQFVLLLSAVCIMCSARN